MSDFLVIIMSHGRAEKLKTFYSLGKQGYTGEIVILVDDTDEQADRYIADFNGLDKVSVEVFNKQEIIDQSDICDNFDLGYKTGIFARNASWNVARKYGYQYFLVLDDDYSGFEYMLPNEGWHYHIKDLDAIFGIYFEYLKNCPQITSIAMSQAGDYIGGRNNQLYLNPYAKRKCMNSWFCDTEREFWFFGRLNGDTNTYTALGHRGKVFLQMPFNSVNQTVTQRSDGGITSLYKTLGTYVKSFYTVMITPSCSDIRLMGDKDPRLHHNIKWNNTVPKIISHTLKK